ncbi:multicopper oxidase domain-containing protein [Bacillus sp. TSA-4]|uniref:multicopper oxidase domain-containing protein n=1 Tax=Bacillus sp. TSA-4 TaxID=3078804 RepID=UPI002916DBBB|nr:multicopper oxidase domain-containing protein [Bacillus sp. TSA-4]WNX00578.1 multicopper oxidase domain-containing protein [Bacillus sp. TSA-4]
MAIDKEIEIAKGIKFPGWTYNGTIPGPSFRCTEGDLLRFHFINKMPDEKKVSRRDILKMGTAGAFGVAGSYYLNKMAQFPTMAQAANNSSQSWTKIHVRI